MSDVDLAEFRAAYLGEAEELLTIAQRQCIAIETSLRSGEQNLRAVRELFRAMHTMKGLSAMVGVEPVVVIAHHLEAALRAVDRDGARLTPQLLDGLVRGVREIEQRVRAVAAGQPPAEVPAGLDEALASLDVGAGASAAAEAPSAIDLDPELAGRLTAPEQALLREGIARGRRALEVEFVPSPALVESGVSITTVRERLAAIGELVRVVPRSRPVGPAAPGGLSFTLLLLTAVDDAAVAAALPPEAATVRVVATPPAPRATLAAIAADDDHDTLPRAGVVRVEVARLDDAMERLAALVVTRFRLTRAVQRLAGQGVAVRELQEIMAVHGRQMRDLRAAILRVRMVAMTEVLERVPLLVRGLSRATGKQVRLSLDVGATEVDNTVAQHVFPAVTHLVRNAVDHAIEPAEERAASGKPTAGSLHIRCAERSNRQLEIVVEDDGRGIDRAAVAERAGRAPRNDAELLELLCAPGLSTRQESTTTSGRGMGMDIVRRAIVDQLGGEMLLETTPGRGTRFTLRVPLTISIVDAFAFEVAGERFCVPVATVEEIVEVAGEALVRPPGTVEGGAGAGMVERRGQALPVILLARLFGRAPGPGGKAFVVRRNGESMAFLVDKLLGQQEVVVRPLEDPLIRVRGISGATDLGDGRLTLVLDLPGLPLGAAGEAAA